MLIFLPLLLLICAGETTWLNSLVHQLEELGPHQVTAFRNSSVSPSSEEDLIFEQVITFLPTIIIDLSKITLKSDHVFSRNGPFSYARKSTVFVLFFTQKYKAESIDLRQIDFLLDFLVGLSPRQIRPRCLLVYLNTKSASENWVKEILQRAWMKKFLDFTVLRIFSIDTSRTDVEVYNYNPFTMDYDFGQWNFRTKLFPDKFRDMRGYSLTVPYVYMPPFMSYEKFRSEFVGTGIGLLQIFAKILNFTIDVVSSDRIRDSYKMNKSSSLAYVIKKVVQSLRESKFDMLPVPLYSTDIDIEVENVEKSRPYVYDKFVVAVSTSTMIEMNTSLSTFLYFFINLLILSLLIFLTYFLQSSKKFFNYFTVITLTLGQWTKPPKRTRDRIMYFLIVVLSLTESSRIFAKLTERNVKFSELPVSTAEDVEKSKLVPQINGGLYTLYFKDKDTEQSYKNLKKDLIVVEQAQSCLKSLLAAEKVLCFASHSMVKWFTKVTERADGCPLLRYSEFEFFSARNALFFQPGSPYVEKFDGFIARFIQAGIFELWDRDQTYKSVCLKDKTKFLNDSNHDHLKRQLLSVLTYGYVLSFAVFILELLYKSLRRVHERWRAI